MAGHSVAAAKAAAFIAVSPMAAVSFASPLDFGIHLVSRFDAFGRLFVVDNDPDSRAGLARLLHIVAGGDYGYRYRQRVARAFTLFTAWNGELHREPFP